MAGVNLNEESARILATSSELVGTKIRSCKDESFLPAGLLHRRILDTGTFTPERTPSPGRLEKQEKRFSSASGADLLVCVR